MADQLVHYLMLDSRARCAVAVTTDLVREAQRRHDLGPIETIALGRALSCAALLASTLKQGAAYVHVTIDGGGPLGRILAECNGEGHCRGYVQPRSPEELARVTSQPETIGQAVGVEGHLKVVRGRVGDREPHVTIVPLQSGEIATDVNRYLVESDQIPSAVAAGVKLSPAGEVLGAGGALVQQMGGQELSEEELKALEVRLGVDLKLSDRIAAGADPDEIFEYLSNAARGKGHLLLRRPLSFRCSCSRERLAGSLFALGVEELRDIVDKVGKLEARCSYCAATYTYQLDEFVSH